MEVVVNDRQEHSKNAQRKVDVRNSQKPDMAHSEILAQ